MRLNKEQREQIRAAVRQFDADAEIRVYGSLLDDKAEGGEIDMLILSKTIGLYEKLQIRSRLKEIFGNRKIDLLITPVPKTAFEKYAMENSEIL
jgi:uncharacterized protein